MKASLGREHTYTEILCRPRTPVVRPGTSPILQLDREERIRRAVRAAKLERSPAYTEILRRISPEIKMANANSLFIMARDALYFQKIRRGHSPEEAMKIGAQRPLSLHDR